ncbi:conserved hypothetical protein [Roseibium sp. TrichSKD4]|nr:conserved hypothetical protein [Roseibium sp. TrichSKD4]
MLPFLSVPVDQAHAKDRQDAELELTDQQANDLAMFVLGNTLFTLYHESGHMLV